MWVQEKWTAFLFCEKKDARTDRPAVRKIVSISFEPIYLWTKCTENKWSICLFCAGEIPRQFLLENIEFLLIWADHALLIAMFLQALARLSKIFEERGPAYANADITVSLQSMLSPTLYSIQQLYLRLSRLASLVAATCDLKLFALLLQVWHWCLHVKMFLSSPQQQSLFR